MDRLVELKRTGEEDPDFGREISERKVPAKPRSTPGHAPRSRAQPARSDVAADNPLFRRPSWARGWPRASRSTTSPSTST